jgi:hypothetical protein
MVGGVLPDGAVDGVDQVTQAAISANTSRQAPTNPSRPRLLMP